MLARELDTDVAIETPGTSSFTTRSPVPLGRAVAQLLDSSFVTALSP